MPLISTLRLPPLLLSALGLMTVDSLTNNSVVKKTILRTRRIISFSVATFFFVLSLVAASCSVHSIFDVVRVLSLLFFPNNLFLFSKNSPAYHLPLLTQQFSFKVYKRHKHTHNWNVRAFCVGHRHFGAYKLRLLNCVRVYVMRCTNYHAIIVPTITAIIIRNRRRQQSACVSRRQQEMRFSLG